MHGAQYYQRSLAKPPGSLLLAALQDAGSSHHEKLFKQFLPGFLKLAKKSAGLLIIYSEDLG